MKKFILFLSLIICFYGCDQSTETDSDQDSDALKLVLSADKTTGSAPLSINFTGKILGNTEGLIGHVPDYLFFSDHNGTLIRYIIPDTSVALNINWNTTENYTSGEYNVVLLYQGILNGENFDLFSDTLKITVN